MITFQLKQLGALLIAILTVVIATVAARAEDGERKTAVISFGLSSEQDVFRNEASAAASVVAKRFGGVSENQCEIDLPLPIAERALELGHALEVNSQLAHHLRATLLRRRSSTARQSSSGSSTSRGTARSDGSKTQQ